MAQIRCDVCQESFNRQSSLTRHKQNLHADRPPSHACTTCSKHFSRRDLLLRHERLHRGEGLSPCEICYRDFRRDYLDKHLERCRLKALKPLSSSAPSRTPRPTDVAKSCVSGSVGLQWQPPTFGLVQVNTLDRNQGPSRRVQQPHRYVILRDPRHFATDAELLDQIVAAIENWNGSLSVIKAILELWHARGHSPRRLDELSVEADGSTLIARACYDFTHDIAEYLLTLDLDFTKKDELGRTALHWLSRNGLTGLVEKLLGIVDDISSPDENGDSALCLAARNGHVEVVKLLCARGAEVNVNGQYIDDYIEASPLGYTPLEYAVSGQEPDAVMALLDAGADPNLRGKLMPLEAAILHGSRREVDLLLGAGAEIDLIEVFYIATLEKERIACFPEGSKISKAAYKLVALKACLKSNRLARKAELPSASPLSRAITTKDGAMLIRPSTEIHCRKVLVGDLCAFSEDGRYNQHGHNPLMLASRAGDVERIRYLLHSYPDLSITDYAGWTPLHHACKSGSYEIARILIQEGAKLDYCSGLSSTPLCIAAMKGHNTVISLLLKAGANVDGDVELCRSSPLYWACTKNHHLTVILLLEKGADVNHGTSESPPLEPALQYGSAALVSTLLAAGASTEHIREACWIDLRMAAEHERPDGWREAAEKIRLLEAAFDGTHAHELIPRIL